MEEEKEKEKNGATGTTIVDVDTTTSSDRKVSGKTTTSWFAVTTSTEKVVMEDAMGGLVCR